MESIVQYFANQGLNFWNIMILCGVLLLGTIFISILARLLFGRHSLLNSAVSSAIGILFIYTVMLVINAFASNYAQFFPPLPFSAIAEERLYFFPFLSADYTTLSSQLLSMILLSFGMNLLDRWLPKGRHLITWLFFRIITVGLAVILHSIIVYVFTHFLPQGFVLYSPAILLAILVIMLLTGALKLIVGLIMATVNPLIAALYTFFFANIIGKQVTKAVLTTGLLAGLVILMEKIGITSIAIGSAALIAYIPFALVLAMMWYVVHKSM